MKLILHTSIFLGFGPSSYNGIFRNVCRTHNSVGTIRRREKSANWCNSLAEGLVRDSLIKENIFFAKCVPFRTVSK